MQKIEDKIVYNTIEEIIDPSHTALVVCDVQRALIKMIFNKEEFSSNLNSVVELARKSNIPIFFTPIQMLLYVTKVKANEKNIQLLKVELIETSASVGAAIVNYAEKNDIDLIVLGTKGYSGIKTIT